MIKAQRRLTVARRYCHVFEHEIDKVSDGRNTLLLGACGDERATMVENSTGTTASALGEIMEPSVDLLVGDALLTERAWNPIKSSESMRRL